MKHLIVDGHLDLAMNGMDWNRDLRLSVEALRASEKGMTDLPGRSYSTLSFDAMRKGRIGLCMSTLLARYVKPNNPLPGWNSPDQAWAHTQGQLAWYRAMEEAGEMVQIQNKAELDAHLTLWEDDSDAPKPIGFVLTLEGADSMIRPEYVGRAHEYGLRAIGLAHFGPGTYAKGSGSVGGIGPKGRELLSEMEPYQMILDTTHLAEVSFWDAINFYKGPVWASHCNSRSLVAGQRQLSDDQMQALLERGAVIGTALANWMLTSDWKRDSTHDEVEVGLRHAVEHIDYVCQKTGNALQAALGTDLDGGFGRDHTPADLETITDLQKLDGLLTEKGYSDQDIGNILGGNWIRFLKENWK